METETKNLLESIQRELESLKEAHNKSTSNRFIDVSRIPLICADIATIRGQLKAIEDNIRWGVRIVIGAVIMALLGMLFV